MSEFESRCEVYEHRIHDLTEEITRLKSTKKAEISSAM